LGNCAVIAAERSPLGARTLFRPLMMLSPPCRRCEHIVAPHYPAVFQYAAAIDALMVLHAAALCAGRDAIIIFSFAVEDA